MKDIKENFVDCNARPITPRGRKRRSSTEANRHGKRTGCKGCRLIYAVARDGKNYERNATSRRATPNLICPHPRPPLGFANKITLEDIGGRSGPRRRAAPRRAGRQPPDLAQLHPRRDFINLCLSPSLSSTCVLIPASYHVSFPASFFRIILATSDTAAERTKNPDYRTKAASLLSKLLGTKLIVNAHSYECKCIKRKFVYRECNNSLKEKLLPIVGLIWRRTNINEFVNANCVTIISDPIREDTEANAEV